MRFDSLKSEAFGSQWSTPWQATSCPSSMMRFITSGACFAKFPVQKNVAFTLFCFSTFRIRQVPSFETSMPSFSVLYFTPCSRGTSNSSVSKLSNTI